MSTRALTRSEWTAGRMARMAALALGPAVTLWALLRLPGVAGDERASLEFAATLLWSPFFCSVPALLLQHERDLALSAVRPALLRGLRLVPHLLFSRDSTVRPEMAASIGAWALLSTVTFPSVLAVVSRLLPG